MSFNMAAYQNVANVEKENRDARQEAMKKAGENQAETQEFKVDKINEFQKAAEKASRRFGLGRIGGMAGGILLSALVPGLGTAAAMMIGSGLGGAIGKEEPMPLGIDGSALDNREQDNYTNPLLQPPIRGAGYGR